MDKGILFLVFILASIVSCHKDPVPYSGPPCNPGQNYFSFKNEPHIARVHDTIIEHNGFMKCYAYSSENYDEYMGIWFKNFHFMVNHPSVSDTSLLDSSNVFLELVMDSYSDTLIGSGDLSVSWSNGYYTFWGCNMIFCDPVDSTPETTVSFKFVMN